jgi:hypothetical protein
MAIAAKRIPPSSPQPRQEAANVRAPGLLDHAAIVVDRIYRFLASLKLAVISLGALAATLAYATFFESWYGTGAAQEYIYKSAGFAVLLAFLGMNILCAALIRYPWKKRQTGFVVTHAGLLTVLVGSYYSVRTGDEGQVGMIEGDVKNELVRIDYPVIRVWETDPHTRERQREFDLPFRPGPFEWGPGKPRSPGGLQRALGVVSLGLLGPSGETSELLTKPGDPFRFEVKQHLPAAALAYVHVADPNGTPMARIALQFKGPGMPTAQDAFRSEREHWFMTDRRFYRIARSQRPALVAFGYVDRPELAEDFLKPPADPGTKGVARFRYRDRLGKERVFDWVLEGQEGKSVALPDSDLKVSVGDLANFPTQTYGLDRVLGDDPVPTAVFKIQSAGGEPVTHMAMANLPMVPNVMPSADEQQSKVPRQPLAAIHLMVAPTVDPKINGRFGQIEVLATAQGKLYYRVFGRGKESRGELRASGSLSQGKPVVAFGGGANMPMTITFQLDEYMPAGVEKAIYEPVVLPKGQMGNGIAASRAEMTVGGQTKEVWLSRSADLDPPASQTVAFRDGVYELCYDVDRKPLGFSIKLDDFDMGFEPGTEQATHFESKVRLTDKSAGITDQPCAIYMNHPLDHRGYTFYQSNYIRVRDPDTGQFTGQFQSVFQVASNPGRPIIYAGCLLVVIGAFLQFYMRAGVFTDGGKRERKRATKKKPADTPATDDL